MVQGDKDMASQDDAGEIDRIMKEIEELEKNMDIAPSVSTPSEAPTAPAKSEDNVVPLRGGTPQASLQEPAESLVESDAVLPHHEPLVKSQQHASSDGALSLKIGGCAEVHLEFSQAGVSITLQCGAEGLSISTDQGAEFRIPFKKAA